MRSLRNSERFNPFMFRKFRCASHAALSFFRGISSFGARLVCREPLSDMIIPLTAQELATLVDAHFASLLLFVRQWEPIAPEDVVQDAFLQLLRFSRKNGKPAQPHSWLFRVARNEAITRFRKKQRREKHEQQLCRERKEWFESSPDKNLQNEELAEALEKLPLDRREIVVMRIWGELSFDEIAELTETPKTTVFRKYNESLEMLKSILE